MKKHKKIINKLNIRRKKTEKPLDKRITNDNLADHREEVLDSARKYIYPLRQPKHRLVKISAAIFTAAVIGFFSYCALALYKAKSDSGFLYQVTKVVPFPIARIGSDFVSYESYLFEVNHYEHYYKTQQNVDFNSDSGKRQLAEFKKRALEKVINDAYVKEIAREKGINVSSKEVDERIDMIRSQNRIGSSDKEFRDVLREFWDWSVNDFRRSLKQQILNEKVVSALDTEARDKAQNTLSEINSGKDFAKVAKAESEDPSTKSNGGEFGFEIDKNNRDISPATIDALFRLQPGQVSGIINVGYGLEIVKVLEKKGDKVKAAHIIFNFRDINQYLGPIKDQRKARTYVNF
ncbi:MAG TPA: peptidylprolyl isomerase [Candidatus Saccharimonadales bacterium]|nr:peptidylprolyl isomerase [Candidatus Saccharimonadales bacterium]